MGEVPEHWKINKLNRLSNQIIDGAHFTPTYVNEGIPFLRVTDIQGSQIDTSKIKYIPEKEHKELTRRCNPKKGDLLLSKNGTIGIPKVIDWDWEFSIFVSLCLIKLKPELNPYYAYYMFLSDPIKEHINDGVKQSTVINLHLEKIAKFIFSVPPIKEQIKIAAFLDRKTAKIDKLITEQEHLIELLQEKITSLVLSSANLAETQQLRLVHVASIISRPVIQKPSEIYTPIGLFNRGRGLFHKDIREMDNMGDSDFFWIEESDLIISGQFAWEGAVALAQREDAGCVVSHRYPVLRGKPGICLTEYLFALLLTNYGDFLLNENSRGAAGRNRPLNINSLMKEKIPVPDMQTQEKVAKAVHLINRLSIEISKQADLLKERRTSLISAAVTGKIDVRDAIN